MKKIAALTLSLFLTNGIVLADTPKDTTSEPAKAAQPAKPKAAKSPAKSDSAIAAEIEELRQALQSQQEQLQLLKEELAKRDRQIDEAREAAAAANARAAEATTKATEAANTTAEVKTAAASLNTTVTELKASNEALKTTVANNEAQAEKAAETGPTTIKYKGVDITPGGWIEAATVSRTRGTSADINTPFTAIPYPGQAIGKVPESNFTARQSRLTLLGETKLSTAKVSMYYEGDFLGTGVTSNNRQSNSYVFRQRQLWASVKFDSGLYVSGGQMWSLVTESKKGIENRQEAFPLMIDPQYIVGWAWQRAYGFRVAKNWDKFAFGIGIEGPQTTIGGRGFPNNFFINAPGAGGGLYNFVDTSGYSLNRAPDFLVKATADPSKLAHFEVVGIFSTFRNRIYPCGVNPLFTPLPAGCGGAANSTFGAFNDNREGGGGGATARVHLMGNKLDVAGHVQGGYGIGRYSTAQLADLTARPDGTLAPIHSYAWLGTIEAHPTPKFDLFAYYGGEYAARTAYAFNNAAGNPIAVGYGSRFFNNSGCNTETFPAPSMPTIGNTSAPTAPGALANCAGDIHHIIEGTVGFWQKFYQGPKGRLQWGITYSYITRYGWSGNGFTNAPAGAVPGPSLRPHAVDNMIWTSFRYYLP